MTKKTITNIKAAFEAVSVVGLDSFQFSTRDTVNKVHAIDYPVLLFLVPDSVIADPKADEGSDTWNIELWFMKPRTNTNETIDTYWSDLSAIADLWLQTFFTDANITYILTSEVSRQFMEEVGQDKCAVVSLSFQMKALCS
jgi:hypothetical protein